MLLKKLLFLLPICFATDSVKKLTVFDFDEFIKTNDFVLVKFYAEWCGHCQALAPEYENAAEKLKSEIGVLLAEVDAVKESDLATKFNVDSYPTILFFRKGVAEKYFGGRTSDTIIEWVKDAVKDAVDWVGEYEFAKNADYSGAKYILSVPSKTSEVAKSFTAYADTHRSDGKFYAYVDAKGPEKISILHHNEDPIVETELDGQKITEFIGNNKLPIFGAINANNYELYIKRSLDFLWLASNSEDYYKVKPIVVEAAKKMNNEFNFVWLDTSLFVNHAKHLLDASEYPALVATYKELRYHSNFKFSDLSSELLVEFLKDVMDGKVAVRVKSEPIPQLNGDELVEPIVGLNFEEKVLRNDADVLLFIYAPWCTHCKKFSPIFEKFAEEIKGKYNLNVLKMDGVQNEANIQDFGFVAYPTIFYVRAGESTPINFDGERTSEGLKKFVEDNLSDIGSKIQKNTDNRVDDEL